MDDRLKRRIDTVERALEDAQGAEHAALVAELERLAVEARVRGVALPAHVRDRLRSEVDAELEARFDNMPI
ncbi:hypothetical protein [Alloyangia pacifica]|uniref:hypothetical protein n=1 Tax=Alloyangia pacifica TaxID=311180 RepID=UPI001CFD10AE|nr:hypothetical protein [Alloyangia pacifica]